MPKERVFTKEELNYIDSQLRLGYNLKEVAKTLNINYKFLNRKLNKLGLTTCIRKIWTEEEWENLAKEHLRGKSLTLIAQELKVTRKFITDNIRKRGYFINSNDELLPNVKAEIEKLLLEGRTLTYIGNVLNITWHSINNHYKDYKVKQYLISKEEELKILELYKTENFSIQKIVKLLGYKADLILNIVNNYITSDLPLEFEIDIDFNKKYNNRGFITHNPFINLEDINTQYWLGIIASDGCLTDKGWIKLDSIDLELLEKYKIFLNSDKVVIKNRISNKKYGTKEIYNITFKNNQVRDYLTSLGITPRKSKTLVMNIPLSFSFLKGYFDGNGSISIDKRNKPCVSIASASYIFSKQVLDFLFKNNINCYFYQQSKINNIRISSLEHIENLFINFYDDNSNNYLSRKRNKFLEVFKLKNSSLAALYSNV